MKACTIDGCGKPLVARGWCHAHYKKWQLHDENWKCKERPSPLPQGLPRKG